MENSSTWECQTTLPVSYENYVGQGAAVRTGHGTTDWSKLGKEHVKALYVVPLPS